MLWRKHVSRFGTNYPSFSNWGRAGPIWSVTPVVYDHLVNTIPDGLISYLSTPFLYLVLLYCLSISILTCNMDNASYSNDAHLALIPLYVHCIPSFYVASLPIDIYNDTSLDPKRICIGVCIERHRWLNCAPDRQECHNPITRIRLDLRLTKFVYPAFPHTLCTVPCIAWLEKGRPEAH